MFDSAVTHQIHTVLHMASIKPHAGVVSLFMATGVAFRSMTAGMVRSSGGVVGLKRHRGVVTRHRVSLNSS